jgi:hypothetical protein
MGGALTQLAAYGAQDVYLTGNTQIPFWKENFKGQHDFSTKPMRRGDLDTIGSTGFTLKHAAIFASAVALAIIFFYMKRNRLSLVLLVAIAVIFTLYNINNRRAANW